MRCRHFAPVAHRQVGVYSLWERRCLGCGSWLPLGPANDASPEVQVEIRAAELVAENAFNKLITRCYITLDELHGWRDFADDDGGDCRCSEPGMARDVARNWHAGYLARCIATHEEG